MGIDDLSIGRVLSSTLDIFDPHLPQITDCRLNLNPFIAPKPSLYYFQATCRQEGLSSCVGVDPRRVGGREIRQNLPPEASHLTAAAVSSVLIRHPPVPGTPLYALCFGAINIIPTVYSISPELTDHLKQLALSY